MAMEKAKEIVSKNAVVVFRSSFGFGYVVMNLDASVKTYCPYCVKIKNLLQQLGANFKLIELDNESDGSQVQSALAEWTGQRTVPNVFIGGKHIGGCDSAMNLHSSGKLVPMLTEAGAVAATTSAA